MKQWFKPVEKASFRVISLGAGVQSSVMSLKAAKGELKPSVDCAVFADTGWEPKAVYDHLNWLEKQLPFPVYRVNSGNLKKDLETNLNTTGHSFASIPFFLVNKDGSKGMARRQCTSEYKLKPIRKKIRELVGLRPRQRTPKDLMVEMWIGISKDEIMRVKENTDSWVTNRWPLIEENMTRQDCLNWFNENYPDKNLVKSACVGCPFHNDDEWRHLKYNSPEEFAEACHIDEILRDGEGRFKGKRFLHSQRIPLKEVDLSTAEELGQQDLFKDLMQNECEGMCGV
jgi:hypothetical protein|tara:strand:+ start:613 stop:1467 length:855 start_codon:yes stop_codon:yes gene_type:complete